MHVLKQFWKIKVLYFSVMLFHYSVVTIWDAKHFLSPDNRIREQVSSSVFCFLGFFVCLLTLFSFHKLSWRFFLYIQACAYNCSMFWTNQSSFTIFPSNMLMNCLNRTLEEENELRDSKLCGLSQANNLMPFLSLENLHWREDAFIKKRLSCPRITKDDWRCNCDGRKEQRRLERLQPSLRTLAIQKIYT